MSDPVAVAASTPLPPKADARVEGVFDVSTRFSSKTGYGRYEAPNFGWRITPKCPSGPCAFAMRDITRSELNPKFKRSGGTYRARFSARFDLECEGTPVRSTGTILIRVAKARMIADEWRATRLVGELSHQEAAQLGCSSSRATLILNARLYE